jgi:hypothetical protein
MKFSTEFNSEQQGETRLRQPGALTSQSGPVGQALVLSLPDRLAEAARLLEHLDQERASIGDPGLGRIIEERIVSRELLDLELQDFDEEVERLSAAARGFLTQESIAGVIEQGLSPSEARSLQLCRSTS